LQTKGGLEVETAIEEKKPTPQNQREGGGIGTKEKGDKAPGSIKEGPAGGRQEEKSRGKKHNKWQKRLCHTTRTASWTIKKRKA